MASPPPLRRSSPCCRCPHPLLAGPRLRPSCRRGGGCVHGNAAAEIRRLEDVRRAAALFRSHPRFAPPADFAAEIRKLVDVPPGGSLRSSAASGRPASPPHPAWHPSRAGRCGNRSAASCRAISSSASARRRTTEHCARLMRGRWISPPAAWTRLRGTGWLPDGAGPENVDAASRPVRERAPPATEGSAPPGRRASQSRRPPAQSPQSCLKLMVTCES